MKVRVKIIGLLGFMIFFVSCILALFIVLSIRGMRQQGSSILTELGRNAENNVRQELQNLADNISNYILNLETEIDKNMLNAARVLYELDRLSLGMLTLQDLEKIKRDTGMSDMYLGDINGVFTLSTEPEAIGISLFDIWEGYRMLVTGESDCLPSDIKVKAETGEIFKFTAIPRADGRGVLESALDAGVIETNLQHLIDSNKSILAMNLFDIDLMTLTCNHAAEIRPVYTKGAHVQDETTVIDGFFNPHKQMYTEVIIELDRQDGRIYYPVIDDGRVRYVLFIYIDTADYFAMQILVDRSITKLVRESVSLSAISLGTVLAVLLVFSVFILFIINRLVKQLETTTEAAKAASQSKSIFLSNMSHEMRTPMNAIIGMTAIGKKTENIDGKNHALNKIGDASSHLLGVINDVLDMAKIEANKLELAPVEYHFEKMLQKVITVANFRVEEKQQRLSVKIDSNIPLFIMGDDQRLAQVVTNLLSNAVKFTPAGGEISLEAFLTEEMDDVLELRICVTDTGIGIPANRQDKLFLAFEQAESGTSREYGGTGLGLSISKRIVELMDGRIWIESEVGKGTRFIFTVKALRSKKEYDGVNGCLRADGSWGESAAAAFANTEAYVGKKLLLAEDIQINREILITLLEDTGIVIDCAENGKEALDMIKAAPDKYDIVFMDMQMPYMGGLEAARRIREFEAERNSISNSSQFPSKITVDFAKGEATTRSSHRNSHKRIPIVAMTANVFKSDIEACLAAGMDDHFGKPVDADKVFEKLYRYLNKE